MNKIQRTTFISSATGLFVFGIAYAIYIARNPFRPRLTWLSVAIGDGTTDACSAVMIWVLTKNWRAALIPFLAHVISGTPMVLGQIAKHDVMASQNSEMDEILRDRHNV